MGQTWETFDENEGGDSVRDALLMQRVRTDSLRSSFSGSAFPTPVVAADVGMVCYRTDQGKYYTLTDDDPATWVSLPLAPVAIAEGGTGAITAALARTALGLGTAAVLASGTGSGDLPTTSQADARYLRISNNLSDLASATTARSNLGLIIGTHVLAYSATVAFYDAAQLWTAAQRKAYTVQSSLTVSATAGPKHKVTPSGAGTLTFSNLADGLQGTVIFINGSDYAIALDAAIKAPDGTAAAISTTGTYKLAWETDGTTVWLTVSQALV